MFGDIDIKNAVPESAKKSTKYERTSIRSIAPRFRSLIIGALKGFIHKIVYQGFGPIDHSGNKGN